MKKTTWLRYMFSFFIIFTLVVCSIHSYLFFKLRPLVTNFTGQMLLFLFFILMLFLVLLRSSHLFENFMPTIMPWIVYTWLGFTIIGFGGFVVVDTIKISAAIIKVISGKNILFFISPRGLTLLTFLISVFISCYAMFEARNVQVRHVTIQSNKDFGSIDTLRIVAVSDLHIGNTIGLYDLEKWAKIIQELNPDILLVSGDIIDADMSLRDKEAQILRSIKTRYGAYAVLGNHEVYSGLENSRDFIKRAGLKLLENSAIQSGPINIVGINDPQIARFGYGPEPDTPAILASVDSARFTLLLKHQPVFQAGEIGLFDLQVSGHTHGGQIWPGRHLVRKIFGVPQGLSKLNKNTKSSLLYLMNGTGYWGPPMRLFAIPEIVTFDITQVDINNSNI